MVGDLKIDIGLLRQARIVVELLDDIPGDLKIASDQRIEYLKKVYETQL